MFQSNPPSVRLIGLLYLAVAILGGASFIITSGLLIVPSDANATYENIQESPHLLRIGIATWLMTMVIDVFIAWLLFELFVSISPRLAALIAIFRIAFVAVHSSGLANLMSVSPYIGQSAGEGNAEAVLRLMEVYENEFMVALVLFGIHLVLVGTLVVRTGMVPRVIGILLILAGLAYFLDSMALAVLPFGHWLKDATNVFVTVAAVLGELSFLFWLLIFGVRYSWPTKPSGTAHTDLDH